MIRKLHHNAYRCRDSEETRRFYEDFLGLPLVQAFEIGRTKTGRETRVAHLITLNDGSHLAFFETPDCRRVQGAARSTCTSPRGRRRGAAAMLARAEGSDRMPRTLRPRDDRFILRDPNGT